MGLCNYFGKGFNLKSGSPNSRSFFTKSTDSEVKLLTFGSQLCYLLNVPQFP